MALKYGSKKGGVQLRSGNGIPFKQMGGSPAQHKGFGEHTHATGGSGSYDKVTGKQTGMGDTSGEGSSLTGIDAIRKVTNNYDTSLGGEDTVVKTDMDEFRKNTVVVDGKTYDKGEEPKDKSEKKGFFQKLGEGLKSDTFRSAAYGAASAAAVDPSQRKMYSDLSQKYGPKKHTKEELQDNEYKTNQIKLQNQKIKAFEDAQNKENELNTTNSTATTDDGHANLDTTKYVTSANRAKNPEAATTYEEFLRRSQKSGDAQTKKMWSTIQKMKKEQRKYGDYTY